MQLHQRNNKEDINGRRLCLCHYPKL